jgi:hypothetical protein
MKRYYIIILIALFGFGLYGCKKDFLDKLPISEISPETFFRTSNDLKLYTNSFYNTLPTYYNTSIDQESEDNIITIGLNDVLTGKRVVPTTGGGWNWSELRKINFYLQNSYKCPDSYAVKQYNGVARFFRAYFYYEKVKMFGDVPWYNTVINTNDDENLMKPSDSRVLVMDSVLADLNYAIANLPSAKITDQVTKWTALALKSRVCLFEGTFRKYHTEFNLSGAEGLLDESINSSEELMNNSGYSIYTSTPDKAYNQLFVSQNPNSQEVILAINYSASLGKYHSSNWWTLTPSAGKPGLEKKLVNSYLMKDGTRFTDVPGFETKQFFDETQNRDPRLAQTIRNPGYTRIGQTQVLPPDFSVTVTGYQITKFVTEPVYDNNLKSTNALPVFRYAEVLLNFAEAKAERGIMVQTDIDKSIKRLRDRVGMPNLIMASANANPDPYLAGQYAHVAGTNKGVILEIRRERRIELMMEGFRRNDLMRWKEGHLYTEQFKGMYFPSMGNYDLDENGKVDVVIYSGTKPITIPGVQYLKLGTDINLENGSSGGLIVVNKDIPKTFDEGRDYLYPLPLEDLLLNPNLKQNPGWK